MQKHHFNPITEHIEEGGCDMPENQSWKMLPLILDAKNVQNLLGISKGKTYELMNSMDFPTIYLGKRMVVSRDSFLEWLEQDRRKVKRKPIIS